MRTYQNKGYQAIMYTQDNSVQTSPLMEQIEELVKQCEYARNSHLISTYIIQYVEQKCTVFSDIDLEYYRL